MPLQFLAGITGLLIVIAVPITVAIPYIVRRTSAPDTSSDTAANTSPDASAEISPARRTFLERMQPHFLIGLLIAGLTVFHALIAMTGIANLIINPIGLALAFIGIFVVIFQLILGATLIRPDLPERRALRKTHFWIMVTLVVLGLGHILLDSPTIARLFHR